MILNRSLLSTPRLGYERKHWGLLLNGTYNSDHETWSDQSTSSFRLGALSASGRYYIKSLGRSLFAKVSAGISKPTLITQENAREENKRIFCRLPGGEPDGDSGKSRKVCLGKLALEMFFI